MQAGVLPESNFVASSLDIALRIWHTTKAPRRQSLLYEVVLLSLETRSIRATLKWLLRDTSFPRVLNKVLYSFCLF